MDPYKCATTLHILFVSSFTCTAAGPFNMKPLLDRNLEWVYRRNMYNKSMNMHVYNKC